MEQVKITECPRDAMQGIKDWIPTETKINYINQLLKVGFDTLDFGSFVSPKAIPQLKDTADVLAQLDLNDTETKLLSIVANKRGAADACSFDEISYLGYPFSISEKFQKRNTNKTIDESLMLVEEIKKLTDSSNKQLVVYISMAFGNPYGENWHPEIAISWSEKLKSELGIEIIALSDTIGVGNPENISFLFTEVLKEFSDITFGAHLHTTKGSWEEKINAAYIAGCRNFDGALKGFGGCPMAKDELTGNMPTENMISYFEQNHIDFLYDKNRLEESLKMSSEIFSNYH